MAHTMHIMLAFAHQDLRDLGIGVEKGVFLRHVTDL